MEEKLYQELCDLRKKGVKVKEWWFRQKAKKILRELQPDNAFKFSDRWFYSFSKSLSYIVAKTLHTAQKSSERFSQPDPKHSSAFADDSHSKGTRIGRRRKERSVGTVGVVRHRKHGSDTSSILLQHQKGATYDTTGEKNI